MPRIDYDRCKTEAHQLRKEYLGHLFRTCVRQVWMLVAKAAIRVQIRTAKPV